MWLNREVQERFLIAVGLLSSLCLGLFFLRMIMTGTTRYLFIPENLALAWLAFFCAWLLIASLKDRAWSTWQNVVLTILWLGFLPNSWYVLTDFVHVAPTLEVSQLYDVVLISSLTLTGFCLGFTSLYLIHQQFLKRLSARASHLIVAAILLLSSFAIYLGRDLRWSTWDVVANPSGIILDVSDRVIDPFGHPRAINVTGLFFILLGTIYLSIWILSRPYKLK